MMFPSRAVDPPDSRSLLLSRLFGDLVGGLVRTSLATLSLRVVFTGLSFVINILLARSLDRAGYGTYAYVLASVGFMSVGGICGMDQLLIRNVAAYRTRAQWPLLKGLVQGATLGTVVLTLLIAGISAGLLLAWDGSGTAVTRPTMLLGLLLLPVTVLNRVRQSVLQGLQRIIAGQTPDLLVQPAVLLLLAGGMLVVYGGPLTALQAVAFTIAATLAALFVGIPSVVQHFPREARAAVAHYEPVHWIRQALPLFFISFCSVISTRVDVLMLGAVKGSEAVGIYTAASRAADLITFFLSAFNVALAPTIARLYAAGELAALQRAVTRSSRLVLGLSLPVALLLAVYGNSFLLLFGSGFTSGHAALVILALGQVIGVAAGSVTLLLTMSGHEADAARVIAATAVWNVAANAVCIPIWGLEGAALATTSGIVLWNVMMAVQVRRRLGIHATVLGVTGN